MRSASSVFLLPPQQFILPFSLAIRRGFCYNSGTPKKREVSIMKKENAIYFDLDGTLADFYGVSGWLDALEHEQVYPYVAAKPLFDEQVMQELICQLKRAGYVIGIVSWSSKSGSKEFHQKIRRAKLGWLKANFPWADEIHVVKYGTPKHKVVKVKNAALVDDEARNLNAWSLGKAIDAKNMMAELERMV
jgi:hypothetical protein